MALATRDGGNTRDEACTHDAPFQVQVSFKEPEPPHSTLTPWTESKAIADSLRPDGVAAPETVLSVQVVPFHSQTSARLLPP